MLELRQVLSVLVMTAALGLPSLASADPFLAYTVTGHGGLSQPLDGLSDEPFWWIDNSGGVPASLALEEYGFHPLPDNTYYAEGYGSLLLSSPFALREADALTLALTLMQTENAYQDYSVGFAVLLEDSAVRAILAVLRASGETWVGDGFPPPGNEFVPTSAGVTTDVTRGPFVDVTLGSVNYHPPGPWTRSFHSAEVTSSYAPGAGTYQLLFGTYNMQAPVGSNSFSALAVDSVSVQRVPEPSTLLLLCTGLGAVAANRRRKRAGSRPA